MPDNSLIVPTVLTTGSLYFASVKPEGTAQDVIDSLVALDEVNSDILGGLEEAGWALQKVREEESGRTWQEHELEAIGDGLSVFKIVAHLISHFRSRHCRVVYSCCSAAQYHTSIFHETFDRSILFSIPIDIPSS